MRVTAADGRDSAVLAAGSAQRSGLPFRVILCESSLPHTDAVELCKELKAILGPKNGIQVVLLHKSVLDVCDPSIPWSASLH